MFLMFLLINLLLTTAVSSTLSFWSKNYTFAPPQRRLGSTQFLHLRLSGTCDQNKFDWETPRTGSATTFYRLPDEKHCNAAGGILKPSSTATSRTLSTWSRKSNPGIGCFWKKDWSGWKLYWNPTASNCFFEDRCHSTDVIHCKF